jgi:hypothetical protein
MLLPLFPTEQPQPQADSSLRALASLAMLDNGELLIFVTSHARLTPLTALP